MENVTTTSFVRRLGFLKEETTVTVERRPTTLSEMRMRRDRWFEYAVDHITACCEIKITLKNQYRTEVETFFEFVTPHGRGCVVDYRDVGGEVEVFIPNKGPALLHGFWTKHGKKVGHAGSYVIANKLNANNPKKTLHTCPARIYAVLAGKNPDAPVRKAP